jgi:hemerythrin-like domain-containing protein
MQKAPVDLYEALRADHRRLDELFDRLLDQVHVNDTALADATWSELERGLAGHLEAEEKWIFPAIERALPDETRALRAEHAAIREELAELGVELEIHALREETAERFIATIRAHGAREDDLLYRWADKELAEGPRASVLERLRLARVGPPGHDGSKPPAKHEG